MPVEIWLGGLLGIIIVLSIVCLEMKSILSSLVTLGVIGLIVSLSFLILQAPDLALVQFVYEILIISIAIIVFTNIESKEESTDLNGHMTRKILTAFLLLPVLMIGCLAFQELPAFGQPLLKVAEKYLTLGAQETGVVNLVAAITLDYRVYDTLGEAIVIFAGVLGAITLIRKVGRQDHGEQK